MKQIKKKYILLISILLISIWGFSQDPIKSKLTAEEELLYQRSLTAVENNDFSSAHRMFSQLLSLYPQEPVFKYHFAICMIQLRQDFRRAINYLEDAANHGLHKSFFYIGNAYHYLYDFNRAINYYERFKTSASSREIRSYDVDRYIQMAENGRELVRYAYELRVVNNIVLSEHNFHYSYDFTDFGGRLLTKPEVYRTRADRHIQGLDLMYVSDRHNVIYMSSYGSSRRGSLNIYVIKREDGKWGEPEKLPAPVNDEYDQAYPFIAADGISLYFSSKGHNTMGGYDIFRSVFDTISLTWSKPENLDFPINTPYDDIMFVKDVFGETAFFASNRETQDERISIYRILLEKDPPLRMISSIEDAHRTARLEIDRTAVAELSKRESQREKEIPKEQEIILLDSIPPLISAEKDTSILILKAQKTIDTLKDLNQDHLLFANNAFDASSDAVDRIKEIRIRKQQAKDSGNHAEHERLQKEMLQQSTKAVVMFNVARNSINISNNISARVEYHQNELNSIIASFFKGENIDRAINQLLADLNRISRDPPGKMFTDQKMTQMKNNEDKISEHKAEINIINNQISNYNNLIDSLSLESTLSANNTERQQIINQIISADNSIRNLMRRLQNIKIDKIIAQNEVEIAGKEISTLVDIFKEYIEDPRTPNFSHLQAEIDILNVYLNQENLRKISESQNRIIAETTYRSRIDDIISEINKHILAEVHDKEEFIKTRLIEETSEIVSRQDVITSPEILEITEIIAKKENISKLITEKELDLSLTDDPELQDQIRSEKDILKENMGKLLSEFSEITTRIDSDPTQSFDEERLTALQEKAGPRNEIQNDISKMEILFESLRKTNQNIELLSLEGIDEDDPVKTYLNLVKTDLISQLTEKEEFVSAYINKIEAVESGEVSDLISLDIAAISEASGIFQDDLADTEKILLEKYTEIATLQESVENIRVPRRREREQARIDEALQESVELHLDYLNKKISLESGKNKVYKKYFEDHKAVFPEEISFAELRINTLLQEAEDLISVAETSELPAEKISLLSDAKLKKQEISAYYEIMFEVAAGKAVISDIAEVPLQKVTPNLALTAQKVIQKDPVIEEISVYEEDMSKIKALLEQASEIEKEISRTIILYEEAEEEESEILLEQLVSLQNKLSETITDLNKEALINQQKQILHNQRILISEFNDDTFSMEITEYEEKSGRAFQSNDYYLLAEVIILGENIIRLQNSVLGKPIEVPSYTDNIKLFYNFSRETSQLVAEIQITAEFEEELHVETITETDFSEYLKSYISENSVLITSFMQKEQELENVKRDLERAGSARERAVLEENLEKIKSEQLQQLVEISELRSDLFKDFLEIYKESGDTESTEYLSYKNIYDEIMTIRNTIINYNHFHDLEALKDFDRRSSQLESEAFRYIEYLSEITEIPDTRIIISAIEIEDETEIHEDVDYDPDPAVYEISLTDQIERFDEETMLTITALQTQKDELTKLMRDIKYNIDELKTEKENVRGRRLRIIENEIDKYESSYVETVKSLAKTELQIIDHRLKAADIIFDGIDSSYEIITHISDSLRSESILQLEMSKDLYQRILDYDEPEISPLISERLEIAHKHADSAFINYQRSLNLRYYDTISDPFFSAYYTQIADERMEFQVIEEEEDTIELISEPVIIEIVTEPEEVEPEVREIISSRPTIIPGYIFDEVVIIPESESSLYSDENPIEEIEEIPDGLNYRIQIGAFNRPVPNESFRGISPVLIENVPGSRLLRYVVGLFSTYENAQFALPSVRNLGYNDCFVVAYYNGERIPLFRARQIEEQMRTTADLFADVLDIDDTQVETPETRAVHQDISETSEVFFTVQIGVYRTLVNPTDLFGLSPIIYDRLDNGLIRHLFGKFPTYASAVEVQNTIRRLGITDAFVTAYHNGRRISNTEAGNLVASYEPEPGDITETLPEPSPITPEPRTITSGPEYFVQIGAYRQSIGPELRQRFSDIATKGELLEVTGETNLIIYRIGRITTYDDALEIRNNAINAGITDAFIIALINGERVSTTVARQYE